MIDVRIIDVLLYISETNHVSRVCNAAALLCLQDIIHVTLLPMKNVLSFYNSTFRNMCTAPCIDVF